MGLFDLFWNYSQEQRIRGAATLAQSATIDAETMRRTVADLAMHVERTTLINQALWELLRDHEGLTEAQLEAKVQEIDLRDGAADGRLNSPARSCPKCGKPNSSRRVTCMYCGTSLGVPR